MFTWHLASVSFIKTEPVLWAVTDVSPHIALLLCGDMEVVRRLLQATRSAPHIIATSSYQHAPTMIDNDELAPANCIHADSYQQAKHCISTEL